jgi:ribonucleoside-diphosphate reductase alpha chain
MASRKEALACALEFYGGDELAARVWVDKYALRDKAGDFKETSPTQMHDRLLRYFPGDAGVDEAVRGGWFVPAGRILFAMGNTHVRATQLNCFVIPIKSDSLESIFECAKEMARTYSYGGGCGIDIGCLRPSGASVNNTAMTASGSVSFMDFFSKVTGTVGQHGRRGALMITIPVDHPDAPAFICTKDDLDPAVMAGASAATRNFLYNRRAVGHANISVRLTDEFMEAVERGGKFRLRWSGGGAECEREVDAREYWGKLCHQAWKQAEPGLIFWGRMVKESPSNQYEGGEVLTTNPCFTAEMRLHTSGGMATFGELHRSGSGVSAVTDARVSMSGISDEFGTIQRPASPVALTARRQRVFKLTTKHGHQLRCTAYHKFPTPDGRKELRELKPGDTLLLQSGEGGWGAVGNYEDGLILGSLTGDGHVSHRKKGGPLSVRLTFWNEPDMAERLVAIVNKRVSGLFKGRLVRITEVPSRNEQRICSQVMYRYLHDRYGIDRNSFKERVPECVWHGSRAFVRGYLAAFFQADGTVIDLPLFALSVRLSQSNPDILRDVQALLGNFGIISSVHLRRTACERLLPDGKGGKKPYRRKSNYDVIINKPNALLFEKKIGFAGNKRARLRAAFDGRCADCHNPERFATTVKSIELDGAEDVFCLNEPETHSIVVNGVVSANCAEQALPAYDSCDLGSVNLRHMVRDPWTDGADVDWGRLETAVRAGVRFLDGVRTVEAEENRFPLPQQREVSERFRRVGLGVMGLGEMIASLGMVYGSEECLKFFGRLCESVRDSAYDESVELARRLGPFPAFDWARHQRCPFVQRLPQPLRDKIAEHGLRNVTVVSFAPTGTIAILGQTSGGIEPMFAPLYRRYSNLGGRERSEFRVYDPAISRWREAIGADFPPGADDVTPEAVDMLPPNFVFSHQVPWRARVEMQALAQRFVDSSISSTINLPPDASEDEVSAIYTHAWKAGCKGVTVYREGCRENILETIRPPSPGKPEKAREPWTRPTVMDSRSVSFMCHNNRVLIDFCRDSAGKLKEVKIVMGRSGDEIHALCEALGRCVSKLLQSGADVAEIAESLRGIKSGQTQWLRFDSEQDAPYVVRSVPDAMSAYMHHAFVKPAREAASRSTTTQPPPLGGPRAADESHRAGSCPQCDGVDEYGRS